MTNSSSELSVDTQTLYLPKLRDIALSGDGRKIVGSMIKPHIVGVWDFKTGRTLQSITEDNSVFLLDIDPGGEIAFSVWRDGTVKAWNIHSRQILCQFQGISKYGGSYTISGNQKTIVGHGSERRFLKAWNAETGKEVFSHFAPRAKITSNAITQNGQTLIIGTSSIAYGGLIQIWDLSTGKENHSIITSTRKGSSGGGYSYSWGVGKLLLSADETMLLAGMNDGVVQVYDFPSGGHVQTIQLPNRRQLTSQAPKMAIGPNKRTLFVKYAGYSSDDDTIKIWDIPTGELKYELKSPYVFLSSLVVSPDSRYLLCYGKTKTEFVIDIWNWQRRQIVYTSNERRDISGHIWPDINPLPLGQASVQYFSAPQLNPIKTPTEIKELNPEQQALLNKICDRWFQVQTSTQTDRSQAEAALYSTYQEANLAPPSEILWQPNPIAGMRAYINALQLDQKLEQGVEQGLTAAINAVLKPVLEKKLVQKALQMHSERHFSAPIINKVIIPAVGKAIEDVVTPRVKKSGLALSVSAAIADVQKKLCTQEFKIAIQQDIQQRMDSQFSRDLAELISKSQINNTYNASFRSIFHYQGLKNINPNVSQSLLSAPWNSDTLLVHSQIEQNLRGATYFQKEHLIYSVKQLIEAEISKATRKVIMLNGKLIGLGSEGLLLQMGDELKEAIAKSLEKFETKIPENWSKGVVEDAITTITPVVMDYGQSESLKQYFSSSIKKQLRGSARQACSWLMEQYVPKINNSNSSKNGSLFGWETFGIVAKGLVNLGIKEVQRGVCEKFGQGFAEAVEPFILEAIWSAWQEYSPNAITNSITQAFQISLRPDLEKVVQLTAVQVSKDLHQSLEDNVFCSYNLAPTFVWDQLCHEVGWQKEQSQQGLAQTTKQLSWWWPLRDRVIAVPRPQTLELDSQKRLHGEGKVAIAWDGFQLYCYHGVELPPQYGELPPTQWQSAWVKTEKSVRLRQTLMEGIGFTRLCEEIDIADLFLQERNTGLRRFLIQGIGYGRLLDKLGGQVLDGWREYTLLRIDQTIDVEKIYLLKMTCPSTNHIHVIRVPPNTTSARAGATWVNWGIDPEEFIAET